MRKRYKMIFYDHVQNQKYDIYRRKKNNNSVIIWLALTALTIISWLFSALIINSGIIHIVSVIAFLILIFVPVAESKWIIGGKASGARVINQKVIYKGMWWQKDHEIIIERYRKK